MSWTKFVIGMLVVIMSPASSYGTTTQKHAFSFGADISFVEGRGGSYRDENGANAFKPRRSNISAIRTANHLLLSDTYDLALLKPQSTGTSGFFVHNWTGDSTAATTGVRGVSFTPSSSGSQVISISRSSTVIVLMNTLGGTFTYPASLHVSGASRGSFDANNTWVAQGDATFSDTSITPPAGTTVSLTVGAMGSINSEWKMP